MDVPRKLDLSHLARARQKRKQHPASTAAAAAPSSCSVASTAAATSSCCSVPSSPSSSSGGNVRPTADDVRRSYVRRCESLGLPASGEGSPLPQLLLNVEYGSTDEVVVMSTIETDDPARECQTGSSTSPEKKTAMHLKVPVSLEIPMSLEIPKLSGYTSLRLPSGDQDVLTMSSFGSAATARTEGSSSIESKEMWGFEVVPGGVRRSRRRYTRWSTRSQSPTNLSSDVSTLSSVSMAERRRRRVKVRQRREMEAAALAGAAVGALIGLWMICMSPSQRSSAPWTTCLSLPLPLSTSSYGTGRGARDAMAGVDGRVGSSGAAVVDPLRNKLQGSAMGGVYAAQAPPHETLDYKMNWGRIPLLGMGIGDGY